MIGRSATRPTRVTRRRGADRTRARDTLAVEEPLEIRASWLAPDGRRRIEPLAVTMRTPGEDFDLVAGFLHGEAVVRRAEDIEEMSYCRGDETQDYNVVEARLASGVAFDLERLRRNFYATSSCGVCGKASLDAIQAVGCRMVSAGLVLDAALVPELPDRLREAQAVFARTGGLHAAGLFEASGALALAREDVGRHNAVDKTLGSALLARRLPPSDLILVVSGRASFELVQKAVMAGLPALVAVGAPSSLAVDLAARFGQTLIGFARDGGFNVYAGEERVR